MKCQYANLKWISNNFNRYVVKRIPGAMLVYLQYIQHIILLKSIMKNGDSSIILMVVGTYLWPSNAKTQCVVYSSEEWKERVHQIGPQGTFKRSGMRVMPAWTQLSVKMSKFLIALILIYPQGVTKLRIPRKK